VQETFQLASRGAPNAKDLNKLIGDLGIAGRPVRLRARDLDHKSPSWRDGLAKLQGLDILKLRRTVPVSFELALYRPVPDILGRLAGDSALELARALVATCGDAPAPFRQPLLVAEAVARVRGNHPGCTADQLIRSLGAASEPGLLEIFVTERAEEAEARAANVGNITHAQSLHQQALDHRRKRIGAVLGAGDCHWLALRRSLDDSQLRPDEAPCGRCRLCAPEADWPTWEPVAAPTEGDPLAQASTRDVILRYLDEHDHAKGFIHSIRLLAGAAYQDRGDQHPMPGASRESRFYGVLSTVKEEEIEATFRQLQADGWLDIRETTADGPWDGLEHKPLKVVGLTYLGRQHLPPRTGSEGGGW